VARFISLLGKGIEMSITSLDNVAIGMMLVLAFLGIIIVVYHCAKLEKKIEKLEKRTDRIEDFYSPARLEILEAFISTKFPTK
jgi:Na+-transporting methylmalonyl-CoA/oxaloacetate decarboxylase gamma subunit